MKPKIYILFLASFALLSQSCTRLNYKKLDSKLLPVYVESGMIGKDSTLFYGGKPFSIEDNAIGLIDSTSKKCIANGLADAYGYIYIFENNGIPEEFKKGLKTFIDLKSASWKLKKIYELKYDAEICFDTLNFTYHLREKGKYELYEANVNGYTVYRYYNKFVKEDYSNFLKYHEYLRTNMPPENLLTKMELSPALYKMRFNSTEMPDGVLDYSKMAYTSQGTFDKIYFERKGVNNVSYRLRHIYVNHPKNVLDSFFCDKKPNCDLNFVTQVDCRYQRDENSFVNSSSNDWFKYLNKNVIPNYLEKTIRGYKCDCENEYSNNVRRKFRRRGPGNDFSGFLMLRPYDSPPLPLSGNGGPE
jgi:hypothetical protein